MLGVEARLEKLSKGDPQNDFFGKYSVLKKRLLEHEYHFTLANFPGGNDHGPNHIRRVLEYLDKLVPGSLVSDLNAYELFVLLMSVLYHDEGLLRGRTSHAEASALLVRYDVNTYLVNQEDAAYVSAIVMCHSQSGKIEECLKQFREYEPVRGHTVRPRMIAALVRLADGIDEDTRRADQIVEDKASMPPGSAIYWKINQRIKGIGPIPEQRTIKFNVRFDRSDLTADYTLGGKRVSVLEGVVNKLAEIDSERKYCVQFLPPGAQYQNITATFTQVDDVNATPLDYTFDESCGEKEFFHRFPYLGSGGISALDQKMPTTAHATQRRKIEYLNSVSDECRWVDFKGIPVPGGVLRVQVSDMYIEPTATPMSEHEDFPDPVKTSKSRHHYNPAQVALFDWHRKDGSQQISSILRNNDHLVMLGDPGSGKTTLLRYIGFHCANGKGVERFGFDRELVPIYVCLREYAGAFSDGLKPSLLEYLKVHFKKLGLASHLELVLKDLAEDNCVVLLDGLDEVAVLSLRKEIVREVAEFANKYHGNRFVVTSRIVGYREARLKDHFSHFVLDPFSERDIRFFIERWCDAVELGGDKEREKSALSEAIFGSPRVVALAENPLFITILARVHRTYRYLPRTKPLLYGKCVEALLTTMDMSRNMPPVFPDERTANRIMGPLALWMHAEKKGQFVTRKELVARLIRSDSWPQTEDEAGELLWKIEERSGLLVQRGVDRFAFYRLPFQEYYAAKHLVSQMKHMDMLGEHVADPWWREVLIIMAGLLDDVGEPYVAPYLNRALDLVRIESGSRSQPGPSRSSPGLAIAVACAIDQVEAGQGFTDRLAHILVELARREAEFYDLGLRKLANVPAGRTISDQLMSLVTGPDAKIQKQATLYLYHMQGSELDKIRLLLDVAPRLLEKGFQSATYAQVLRLARNHADRPALQNMRTQLRTLSLRDRIAIFHRCRRTSGRDLLSEKKPLDTRWLRTQLALKLAQTKETRRSVKRGGVKAKK